MNAIITITVVALIALVSMLVAYIAPKVAYFFKRCVNWDFFRR